MLEDNLRANGRYEITVKPASIKIVKTISLTERPGFEPGVGVITPTTV
jgi:hypothetical protein